MKILSNFIKTFKENIRDWKILIIVIVFAPCFVYLMNLYFGDAGTSTYTVAVLNGDTQGTYAAGLISEWEAIKTGEGKSILNILQVTGREAAEKMIRNRIADLFITIPADFSSSFKRFLDTGKGQLAPLVSCGDQTNVKYMLAASFIDYTAFNYVGAATGITLPLSIQYESAGSRQKIREFDLYIPALLVLSIIMILFTAGASIIREVEKETIIRLTLSKLSSFQFLTALSMNQIIIGMLALLLTLAAAFTTGYKTGGSILLLFLTGVITCFSVIAISIITTYFIKNMFGLLTIGCFPFFILMFFSDCFMPLPRIYLFRIFGNQLYLNDILPTATATRALNKVLNYNSGFADIQFELIWMFLLSVLYFGIGVFLFKKKYKY